MSVQLDCGRTKNFPENILYWQFQIEQRGIQSEFRIMTVSVAYATDIAVYVVTKWQKRVS
jgi:hypothetical protein